MALNDLDQLLALRSEDPSLAERMAGPLDLEALIALAAERGLTVTEADVFAAQQRENSDRSSAQLQQEAAQESRRLRHFIQG
ncbi:Nif11-like leader peptide family natural product precursor [Synechococcus sp. UW140]|uniref:Nif11-like leader peptide family natural product precursor n=1 Tax=Synechococcus sp. UW140 TaxID=368503 RepID=UPI000E0FB2FF|nr:Nif11-like leader peptide family natural product precursor [Synechococcus sp. UW140]